MIEVKDNGNGVPPEVRDKIFDYFFTTKPPGRGTGLGLSIVSEVVADHDGRVELDAEDGEGSVFRVLLPAHEHE